MYNFKMKYSTKTYYGETDAILKEMGREGQCNVLTELLVSTDVQWLTSW